MGTFKLFLTYFILASVFLAANTKDTLAQLPSSGLKLHLSSDAGITSSNDSVSVWADQSGNGNNATQSVLAQRPIFVSNSINGEPALRFNGTNSYLVLPTATDLGIVSNDYQIFIIAKTISISSNIYFLLGSASATEQYEIHTNGPKGARYIPDSGIYIDEGITGDYTDSEAHIFQVEATNTYGLIRIDSDGVTQTNTDSHSSYSGNLILGTRSGGGFWFSGDIAEVIIYNSVLSENSRDSVENYLKVKYEIDQPIVLPTVQASNISFTEVAYGSMNVSLTPGNGEKRLILAKAGSAVDAFPEDSITYTANAQFGQGTEIGTGNFVIYNGTDSTVTLSGLDQGIEYHISAVEFNGTAGTERYLTVPPPHLSETTKEFTLQGSDSLTVWLRANSGISNATNGVAVPSWSDQSGNDNDAAQATATSQPLFIENAINGLPALWFDGSNDALTLPNLSDLGVLNSDYSAYIIGKSSNNSAIQFFMSAGGTQFEFHLNGSAGARFIPSGSNYLDVGEVGDFGDDSAHVYQMKVAEGASRLRVDNNTEATKSGNFRATVDASLELGRRFGGALPLNGDVAEILIFKNNLPLSRQVAVINYLNDKYDLAVNIPELSVPDAPATDISFSQVQENSMLVSLTTGNGANRLVVARKDNPVTFEPENETYYSANNNFGAGTDLGDGNYVIYNGDGDNFEAVGFGEDTTYHFAVYEYNGISGEEGYLLANPARTSFQVELSPRVASVTPARNNIDVLPNSVITATYSKPINEVTFVDSTSFLVRGNTIGIITGSFSFGSGDTVVTFTPDQSLKKGELITVTSTSKIKSADNLGVNPFSFSFTIKAEENKGTFALDEIYATVYDIRAISLADINQDGNTDLVLASNNDSVSTYLGLGDGRFGNKVNYYTDDGLIDMTTADLNNDGYPDIAGVDFLYNQIITFMNNGDGTFQAETEYSMGSLVPLKLSAADIDGDGFIDLTVGTYYSVFSVLINNGDGTFKPLKNYGATGELRELKTADVNNDGFNDALLVSSTHDAIYLNSGSFGGEFSQTQVIQTGDYPNSLVVHDLNGDGNLDLVVSNKNDDDISVILGNGDGTFSAKTDISVGDQPQQLEAADLNGDGFTDLMISYYNQDDFSILLGNGDGTFLDRVQYSVATSANYLTSGDLNNDGRIDLVTGNDYSSMAVFLSQDNPPFIRASSIEYESETSFTVLSTINPMNFSSEIRVKYGFTKGAYTDSTAWQSIGDSYTDVTDSITVSNIEYNATIYVVIEARNSVGNSLSTEQPFYLNKLNSETVLWLKADEGAFDVVEGKIAKWYDVSGKNHIATQETAANQPVYSDTSMNNNGALRFDGSNAFLDLPNQGELGLVGSDVETFIVYSSSSTAEQQVYYVGFGGLYLVLNNSSNGIRARTRSTSAYSGASGDYTTGNTTIVNTSGIENGLLLTVNADSSAYITGSNQQPGAATFTFRMGASSASSGSKFNGDIAEFIIFNKKLSAQERAEVYEYLALKYGVTGNNLPAENSVTLTGTEGWRLLANPIQDSTLAPLLRNIWTQGFTGATTTSGTTNVYTWPITNASIDNSNWTPLTDMVNSPGVGSGSLVYVFSDDNATKPGDAGFPKTIELAGIEPQGDQNLTPLLNTNVNGFTLLGNPFQKDVDWDDFTRDTLSNVVYVYDHNAAGWKSWNGTLGSLSEGKIGAFNGFFVQTTGSSPSLVIPSNAKQDSANSFLGKEVAQANPYYFSLELKSDSGFSNKAWFQFSEEGDFGIDASDAYQLNPLSPNYVTMASILNDTTHLDINSLPLIDEALEIPLALQTTESGSSHSITKGDLNIPEGWVVSLYDSELEITSTLEEPYMFTMESAKVKAVQTQNLAPPQDDLSAPPSLTSIFEPAKQKQTEPRFVLTISPSQAVSTEPLVDLPQKVELKQNYPNPFNPSTTIAYGVPQTGKVTLEVFDILGRKVTTLLNGEQKSAGRYTVNFNANNLASGMYIYRLQAGNVVLIKKLTLIK